MRVVWPFPFGQLKALTDREKLLVEAIRGKLMAIVGLKLKVTAQTRGSVTEIPFRRLPSLSFSLAFLVLLDFIFNHYHL